MAEGDIARIELVTVGVENYQMSFGFSSISGVSSWREIVLDGFAALMVPLFLAGMSDRIQLQELVIKDVLPGTGLDIIHGYGSLPFGSVDAPPVPPNVAGRLNWRTALQGRSFKGCNFVPGLPNTYLTDDAGRWSVDGAVYLDNLINAMVTAYGPAGTSTFGRFGIISTRENGEPRALPIWTQVISGYSRITVATMRRRVN